MEIKMTWDDLVQIYDTEENSIPKWMDFILPHKYHQPLFNSIIE